MLNLLLQARIYNNTRHVVWLDNLFTLARLQLTLREEEFSAARTVSTTKTKSRLITEEP